ncbi:hypothetical protein [Neobacillus mesonae]|uniref:hypothetical protein n=1 Tax=Neobacillus mesonae TaxID=1193713 RepID=UPI00257226FA|nr:hypothetical protein [Neobacillus mesonae]MED4207148.1 hypothetical protein [Neobacillus mesonae]
MKILYALVILILIIAGICTLLLTGKGDQDYRGAVKKNTKNLTLIYAIIITLSFIALGVYISYFV